MGIRKFAALVAAAALAVGLMGAGLSATFTDNANARQDVNVGVLDIQLDGVTPGSSWDGQTLVCPLVLVTQASGPWDGSGDCSFTIKSAGSIPPSQVTVKMYATTNGAHIERFGITPTGLDVQPAAFYWLSGSTQVVGHVFGNHLPRTVNVPLSWGESAGPLALDNDDMGKWVQVFYVIEAFA